MAKPRQRSGPVPLSLPPSVTELVGPESGALLEALSLESPVSIRLNPLKPAEIPGDPVPWCSAGRYLATRPSFTLDPLLHAGAYYVQEASSMLVEQAFLRTGLQGRDVLALDLCAAPGGKSTHLASLLSPGSLLVCNEPVPARQGALTENIWKHGRANTAVTGSRTEDLQALGEFFDLVLVDAPCSGEGMFRKDPFARQQWTERLVASCARTQHDITLHAWNALRPGGWLIYSTCTWETAENEDHVQRLMDLGALFVPLELDPSWGVVDTDHGHRCYPHRVKGEGLFIALLQKPGSLQEREPTRSETGSAGNISSWLREPGEVDLAEHGTWLHASSAGWAGPLKELSAHLRMVAPGIPVAERKGDGWRPHAALALNERLDSATFAKLDLDRDHALSFLRGETSFPVPSEASGANGSNVPQHPGVRLVRYAGQALGWLHAAGDRWNNGWPKAWRIRMR